MKKYLSILFALALSAKLCAQVPIVTPDLSMKTLIAPAYFGPNAFQVPEMLDGNVSDKLLVELAADYINGRVGTTDRTGDLHLTLRIPLFSNRVNLSVWWAVGEVYQMSEDVAAYRRIPADVSRSGNELGPLFTSVDIQILREKKICPALTVRSVLRTASEGQSFPSARSYDCAGYFFDATVGKSFGPFRLSASIGRLYWQTDNGRQNDATMYGVLASYSHEWFKLSAQFGGYSGWEHAGDRPMTLRGRFDFGPENWSFKPFIAYQHGFRDWPFDQYRAGVSWSCPLNYKH